MLADGLSNCAIARQLNVQDETSVKGGRWTATTVRRLRLRLGLSEATLALRHAA